MKVYKIPLNKKTIIRLTEEDMWNCVALGITTATHKWAEGLGTAKSSFEAITMFIKGKMVLSEKWGGTDYEVDYYCFMKGLKLFFRDYPDYFVPTGKENEVKLNEDKFTGFEADKIIQYGIYDTVMWG